PPRAPFLRVPFPKEASAWAFAKRSASGETPPRIAPASTIRAQQSSHFRLLIGSTLSQRWDSSVIMPRFPPPNSKDLPGKPERKKDAASSRHPFRRHTGFIPFHA